MCSVAGEMLAAYSPPAYFYPLRMHNRSNGGGGRRAATPSRQLPRRPCIVLSPTSEETRTKKKVVFADDRGFSLTQVRMMSEPSNLPPSWSSQFISLITKDSSESLPEPWETTFAQPASDYIEFRKRLDEGNVSLENVFIKDTEEVAIGTAKVKNLCYEKEVFIRFTSDSWATFEDILCTYVNNTLSSSSSVTVLYDTFSFRIPLPTDSNKVEFCVCFRSRGEEFWDNNFHQNYSLLRKMVASSSQPPKSETVVIPKNEIEKEPWTQYSSWIPYW